ncbi:unnamed protein product [Closterium sp. Naga37s-1]|nr:unnamed protein product [Closterium sp. Naga37s-1]
MDLDAVVGLEEQLLAQGHAEGYQDGLRLGREEGRETGLEHGFMIGDELGFMWGCAAAWRQVIQSTPSTRFSPRATKAVQQLQQLISDFPITNPEPTFLLSLHPFPVTFAQAPLSPPFPHPPSPISHHRSWPSLPPHPPLP